MPPTTQLDLKNTKENGIPMKYFLPTLLACSAFAGVAVAEEDKLNTKDPRNTQHKAGFEVANDGDLKFVLGGGTNNWYDGAENQLVYQLEYEFDSENYRVRAAQFDARFGGLYVDVIGTTDTSTMSSVGYMIPIAGNNGDTMFFPSINYSYIALDDKNPIRSIVPADLGGGNNAHMSSLNLYIIHNWNETHFSFIEMFGGKSFEGVEMELYDVAWTQGMNSNIMGREALVYFKTQYTYNEVVIGNSTPAEDDWRFSFGFDIKF